MKKIIFYCQHLLGIGHVSRTMAIVNELAKTYEVEVIMGGPALQLSTPENVRITQIAPLLMTEDSHDLYDPIGKRSVEDIFADRAEQLRTIVQQPCDALVIEFYPFGRKKFAAEVRHFIAQMRAAHPSVKVISSVRDLLVAKKDQLNRDTLVAQEILDSYDMVLVHSDPRFIPFSTTFLAMDKMRERVRYTGFVANTQSILSLPRQRKILISLGGGSLGQDFMLLVTKHLRLAKFDLQFVAGPYSRKTLVSEVEALTKDFKQKVSVSTFLPHFEQAMAESALSISMGGYNTVMNLLKTRTPGLIFPYNGDHEQSLRAEIFEKKGFVRILRGSDLPGLPDLVESVARAPYPLAIPDLSGAVEARRQIDFLLG